MKKNKFILYFILYIFNANLLFSQAVLLPLPKNIEINLNKALLGKTLFFDKRLSSDNTISCSTCHDLSAGGDDNKRVSIGVDNKEGKFNSPTVFNSFFNFMQFWDGRAESLGAQVIHPIEASFEMNTSFPEIIKKLKNDEYYIQEFEKIYNSELNKKNIIESIVEFEKSLITYDSKFDKYLNGDLEALNQIELEGYELFQKRSCISCHNGVNIGANLFQRFGIFKEYKNKNKGRYLLTNDKEDMYVFKVPSLRNVELTAPYLHTGEINTLNEAVSLMYEYQLGIKTNSNEINKIVSFLKTLTGKRPKILDSHE